MIPGTMCDQRLWHKLPSTLVDTSAAGARHLAIPSGASVAELVERLAAALPDRPVSLLGFSLGGYLAAALATAYPERVERLFICANTPCALPEEELRQRRQLLQWVARHGYSGISDRKIAAMLAPHNRDRADIADTMRAMDASLGQAALLSQLGATSERDDLADSLAQLSLPVTFCFGEHDGLVTRPWLDKLRQRRPDFTQCEIPEAGHMLPLEQPQRLAAAIENWLQAEAS
ncbi:2-succinyl-6-hydroxy-2, 4-cyclohexadiene-1-carboxylate synthase [Microbulbifer aestuariivivens]|uniref:2-succinyl-6-hydroxy-2, 4-cyclohexadiene-1-carboxylate synthase n=2 Tax=Microbulbifer aestuariivivens TaxID=1908308 RepID=A0ABP9WKX6_9GAMM